MFGDTVPIVKAELKFYHAGIKSKNENYAKDILITGSTLISRDPLLVENLDVHAKMKRCCSVVLFR